LVRSPTMNWYHREPTLDEIFSDSIVRAVMEADGIDPQQLAATLRQAGRTLVRRARGVPGGGKRPGPGRGQGTETQKTRNHLRNGCEVIRQGHDEVRAGDDHRGSLVDRGSHHWRGC